ncbi:MAG: ATP-binding cassette domain-containing protein [Lachnospiraceae bacterium]
MEKRESAISVKDLYITYKSTKSYSIKQNLLKLKKMEWEKVEAVKGVSFEVKQGEILGIIGKNGSGKSTMLNAIDGIFSPDRGSIDLHGHSISLMSIGVGFQPALSGRENIILSGMLLGFSKEQILLRMSEIIGFAELDGFIDKPVRTYSSGMYSKLAFAITAILETDIMLVDEVLSVGDQRFKRKSLAKMKSLILDEERTVVIVSHNIDTLRELCDRVLWMHEGQTKLIGEANEVLDLYKEFMEK